MSGPLQSVRPVSNETRCPFLLLVDTSVSMQGIPIEKVNQGLQSFQSALQNDPIVKRRVEIALVTFDNSVQVVLDWTPAASFQAPVLSVQPATNLGEAVLKGIEMIRLYMQECRQASIKMYQPVIFLITDGKPTEDPPLWPEAAQAVRREMATASGLMFYAIGVGDEVDFEVLKALTDQVYALEGLAFRELFNFITITLGGVTQGRKALAPTRAQLLLPVPVKG